MSQFAQDVSTNGQGSITRRAHAARVPYPFSALVGQDEMKLALLLNAVSPQIAGVLIQGEKGTAKSTAARALQALLPSITVVAPCDFGCDPADALHMCDACLESLERGEILMTQTRPVHLVELPLGATEDRVLGTLDLERAIKDGVRRFEPGLLASAHRGILYIDEVNLLPDHLVDSLLDAATTGRNIVEREGISFAHPAQFMLIGTMNPEEGELRPQLLDRFGLSVEVQGLHDLALRTEVVKRRIAFEANPQAFAARWQASEQALREQISAARQLLPAVVVPDSVLGLISFLCMQVEVEGLRADLTIYKAASALAALERRSVVTEHDVQRVAPLALAHRRRQQSAQPSAIDPQMLEKLIGDYQPPEQTASSPPSASDSHATGPPPSAPGEYGTDAPHEQPGDGNDLPAEAHQEQASEQVIPPALPPASMHFDFKQARGPVQGRLKRSVRHVPQRARAGTAIAQSQSRQGRVIAARVPRQTPSSLALAPTLRMAALHQRRRHAEHAEDEQKRFWLEAHDVLEPVRQQKHGALVLFVVDASGSMAARKRMAAAKGAVLTLLQRAYQRRDQVGLIQFRATRATILLPPTPSTSLATRALTRLPTGGRTPLAAGLRLARHVLQTAARRDVQRQHILVLVTDGRANVADPAASSKPALTPVEDAQVAARELRSMHISTLVIDTEEGAVRTGLANQLALELDANYVQLATLEGASMANAVRATLGRALA